MDKIENTVKKITGINQDLILKAQERLDNLTKPKGSLGRLEEIAALVAGITGKRTPELKDKVIFTLAADHGVTEEGVSAYPKEVTAQMVYNFLNGGAGINVLAGHVGARVVVADVGVASEMKVSGGLVVKKTGFGTANMARGPAMTRQDALRCVEGGIEIFEAELPRGVDIAGTGEMGIGNTTASSAITAVLLKKNAGDVAGRGAGLDDAGLKNKIAVIEKALRVNNPDPNDPIDVLSKVGGFEIGALSGIILAAASHKVPIVIDGFISGTAALIAYALAPQVKDYMFAAHRSAERAHQAILDHIGLEPLLDFKLRLGEGTGAALAIGIIDASTKILAGMATFKDARVSQNIR